MKALVLAGERRENLLGRVLVKRTASGQGAASAAVTLAQGPDLRQSRGMGARNGRTALVTGASRGMGAAIAAAPAGEGVCES